MFIQQNQDADLADSGTVDIVNRVRGASVTDKFGSKTFRQTA